jgi:hypothetical protein
MNYKDLFENNKKYYIIIIIAARMMYYLSYIRISDTFIDRGLFTIQKESLVKSFVMLFI